MPNLEKAFKKDKQLHKEDPHSRNFFAAIDAAEGSLFGADLPDDVADRQQEILDRRVNSCGTIKPRHFFHRGKKTVKR